MPFADRRATEKELPKGWPWPAHVPATTMSPPNFATVVMPSVQVASSLAMRRCHWALPAAEYFCRRQSVVGSDSASR